MINGIDMKNIIVTSIYELEYEGVYGTYKSFPLLSETIQRQMFDGFTYYIFTNKYTYEKHHLQTIFDKENVTIVFEELNSDFFIKEMEPIREYNYKNFNDGDRIYRVKNYVEVIHMKLEFLKRVSFENPNSNVLWLDAGLFGTSCHDGWRDYLRHMIYDSPILLDKIFDKINQHGFISLMGEGIQINYELKNRICSTYSVDDVKIVPGAFFGGKSEKVLNYLNNNKELLINYIKRNKELLSEQELLYILLHDKDVKFFKFGDWLDLQRSILSVLDMYYDGKYRVENCYE